MSSMLNSISAPVRPARRKDLRWLLAPAVVFLGLLYVMPLLDLFRISFNGHTLWPSTRVFLR